MSQTDNNPGNINNVLNSLSKTASDMSEFLSKTVNNLTPEQKEMLNKELGGDFTVAMKKTQDDLASVMKNINNLNVNL
jgi:hypothetical protein